MGVVAQGSAGNTPGATMRPGRASLFSTLLLLAACADDPVPSGNMVIAAPSPVATVAAPVVAATPSAVPVEPMPSGSPVMRPQKTFVDPPLPAELRDDGGLTPLPPPPGVQNQQ